MKIDKQYPIKNSYWHVEKQNAFDQKVDPHKINIKDQKTINYASKIKALSSNSQLPSPQYVWDHRSLIFKIKSSNM